MAMRRLAELVPELNYDLCVLTGDFRGKTHGSFAATMDALTRLRPNLKGPVYGVLGNHDTIQMVPGLESIGIRLLLNENLPIEHRRDEIYLPVSTTHIFIELTTSKRPGPRYPIKRFRSCCRTLPRYTGTLLMPVSTSC